MLLLGVPVDDTSPLHCLVADASLRSYATGVITHYTDRPLPAGSILRLSPHVCIVSPELCFLQLATTLSVGRLTLEGMLLCGTFVRGADGNSGERLPLTSAAKLQEFIQLAPGAQGAKRARLAASHVLDNAASPMEARTEILLCLPPAWGGYGLPAPELNPDIVLSPAARALYDVKTCRPDLYWRDAKLDVEYDGDSHEGEVGHRKDVARIMALEAEGITVAPLTYLQLNDAEAFDTVATTVAKKLGHRLRIRVKDFPQRRATLRYQLGLR